MFDRFVILSLAFVFSLVGIQARSISIINKEQVNRLLKEENQTYRIRHTIDLDGDTLIIPDGCTLLFKRGCFKHGTIILNQTTIVGRSKMFKDVKLQGSITNNEVYSKWFISTSANDNLLIDAIKVACNSSKNFVFNKGQYTFSDYISLYGNCSLIADGKVDVVANVEDSKIFILAGNTTIGGKKPITWTGKLQGLNFIAKKGVYDNFLGLYNVKDVEVSDCSFDMSAEGVNCANKIIGSVNNAYYSNPSKGENIKILRNTIRVQSTLDDRNNCECIGIENRNNVLIEGNHIFNTRDDLGIHNSTNVVIRNNVVDAYDGRIFVANSKDISIENNIVRYVFPSTTGMGIYLGVEPGYDMIPERIAIKGNVIDYTRAKDTPCYGIRIIGVNYIIVDKNKVYGHPSARIAIEHTKAKVSQDTGLLNPGTLVPEHVIVKDNECNGLWLAGYANLKINDIQFIGNTINGVISITNNDAIYQANKHGKSADVKAIPHNK